MTDRKQILFPREHDRDALIAMWADTLCGQSGDLTATIALVDDLLLTGQAFISAKDLPEKFTGVAFDPSTKRVELWLAGVPRSAGPWCMRAVFGMEHMIRGDRFRVAVAGLYVGAISQAEAAAWMGMTEADFVERLLAIYGKVIAWMIADGLWGLVTHPEEA